MAIEIIIVDNYSLTREALENLLNGTPGFQCVGTYADTHVVLDNIFIKQPHVVLLNITCPSLTDIDGIRKIKEIHPCGKIVVFAESDDIQDVFITFKAGVDGYLVKGRPLIELFQGIEEVCLGEVAISRNLSTRMVRWYQNNDIRNNLLLKSVGGWNENNQTAGSRIDRSVGREVIQPTGMCKEQQKNNGLNGASERDFLNIASKFTLTSRETEILHGLSKGLPYRNIAKTLNISLQTVNSHIKNIYVKLDVHSRIEAVRKYFDQQVRL